MLYTQNFKIIHLKCIKNEFALNVNSAKTFLFISIKQQIVFGW